MCKAGYNLISCQKTPHWVTNLREKNYFQLGKLGDPWATVNAVSQSLSKTVRNSVKGLSLSHTCRLCTHTQTTRTHADHFSTHEARHTHAGHAHTCRPRIHTQTTHTCRPHTHVAGHTHTQTTHTHVDHAHTCRPIQLPSL